MLGVNQIALAGFDGFSDNDNNYASNDLEKSYSPREEKNIKIQAIFTEFMKNKTVFNVGFIIPSRFGNLIKSKEISC